MQTGQNTQSGPARPKPDLASQDSCQLCHQYSHPAPFYLSLPNFQPPQANFVQGSDSNYSMLRMVCQLWSYTSYYN